MSSNIADEQLLPKVSVKPYKFTGEIKMKPLPLGLWVTLKLVLAFCRPPGFQVCSLFLYFFSSPLLSGCKSHSWNPLERCSEVLKVWIRLLICKAGIHFLGNHAPGNTHIFIPSTFIIIFSLKHFHNIHIFVDFKEHFLISNRKKSKKKHSVCTLIILLFAILHFVLCTMINRFIKCDRKCTILCIYMCSSATQSCV